MQVHTNKESREKQPGKKLGQNRAEPGLGRPAWADRPNPFWARFDAPFDLAASRAMYSPLAKSHVLVRKVVPTLTTRCAEIYLSMAGAKRLVTLGFILVPAGAVRPAGVCPGHYIALHRGACGGGLQERRERRPGLQVPEVLIEASANIVVKTERVRVSAPCRPPCGWGTAPPFIGQGGGSLQSRCTVSSMCGGVAYSAAV
jgi:hypothetical protein